MQVTIMNKIKLCYNSNMVIQKVKDTIVNNGLIENGEHIVIGLSGGPDSVCLFHILYQLKNVFDLTLQAVHINHMLRPGEAEKDQKYVEDLCLQMGIPCQVFTYDINKIAKERGTSSEDAGRQMRYASFYQVANSISDRTGCSVKIAVAQNLNDQAETLLMRIMRGTGTDGLAGIEYIRQGKGDSFIIRPLLDITRKEIEYYCKENNLKPRLDLTNLEPIYTRNKIRLELMPYMQKDFNENIMLSLNRLSRIAREDKDYLYQIVDQLIEEHAVIDVMAKIPIDILLKQHPAIRHRIIIRLFESLGLSKDKTWIHLENADKLLMEGKTSTSTDFSGGYAVRVSYNMAEFYKKEEVQNHYFEYQIIINGETEIHELNGQLEVKLLKRNEWENLKNGKKEETESTSFVCFLSYDQIVESGCKLILRTRKQGDYISPLGMKGRKKLQDFFVDMKIKKEIRNNIPLVCLGSEVLWVVGYRINEKFKILNNTKNILLLEYSAKI